MTVRIVFEAEAMKRAKLADMTIADLAERFAQIGVAQDQALLAGETAKFNRLFRQMMDVANELKGREGDQRRSLVELFTFPNMQVRVHACRRASGSTKAASSHR
jgi:hypothetical protein